MKNFLKNFVGSIPIILLFVAVSLLFLAIRDLQTNRPVSAYQDEGVHTFLPYEVTTQTKKVYRHRRSSTTRNTYRLHYRAIDGSGYKSVQEVSSRSSGNQKIKNKEMIERRVFSIVGENKYITVSPEYTIESYVRQNSRRVQMYFAISLIYIGGFSTVWGMKRLRQKNC